MKSIWIVWNVGRIGIRKFHGSGENGKTSRKRKDKKKTGAGQSTRHLLDCLRGFLAEAATESESAVAATAAQNKQNPDNAAAVTAQSKSAIAATTTAKKQNDDDPCAATAVVSLIAGTTATTVCC
jgi:glycerol-3-phosphate acyltransferase PlsY